MRQIRVLGCHLRARMDARHPKAGLAAFRGPYKKKPNTRLDRACRHHHQSHDSTGARWWTVGVSENIIDASFQALMDSIIYKLMKNREMAGLVAAE